MPRRFPSGSRGGDGEPACAAALVQLATELYARVD